ncbi:hypothetical protein MXAN_6118 [Myxococcus xanthus DK 1622]|uniref:Uncharacterized protein n=1 Tax=Myxococcus xanthus (strain DK1622) TaxID=246197 RepID=Q1CZC0_MYXXD|nr:hypothetical protein MXAN_6118 [Myxococcus xanthus DK 1622]
MMMLSIHIGAPPDGTIGAAMTSNEPTPAWTPNRDGILHVFGEPRFTDDAKSFPKSVRV